MEDNIAGKNGNNKLRMRLQNTVSVFLLQSVLPAHQVHRREDFELVPETWQSTDTVYCK